MSIIIFFRFMFPTLCGGLLGPVPIHLEQPAVEPSDEPSTANDVINGILKNLHSPNQCMTLNTDIELIREPIDRQKLYVTGLTMVTEMRASVLQSIGLMNVPYYVNFGRLGGPVFRRDETVEMLAHGISRANHAKFGVEYGNQGHAMPLIVMKRDVAHRFFWCTSRCVLHPRALHIEPVG